MRRQLVVLVAVLIVFAYALGGVADAVAVGRPGERAARLLQD